METQFQWISMNVGCYRNGSILNGNSWYMAWNLIFTNIYLDFCSKIKRVNNMGHVWVVWLWNKKDSDLISSFRSEGEMEKNIRVSSAPEHLLHGWTHGNYQEPKKRKKVTHEVITLSYCLVEKWSVYEAHSIMLPFPICIII